MQKTLTLLLLSLSVLFADAPLEVEIEHNATASNSLMVTLKVTNTSEKSVNIDPTNFIYPEKGFMVKSLFTVSEDGEKVPYIGMIAQTIPSLKKLAPGESYSGSVDLQAHYNIHKGTHDFEINYENVDQNISASLEVEATIMPRIKSKVRTRRKTCSNNQLSALNSALQGAKAYALRARNNLPNSPRNHALYQKWFGVATPGRYNTVYVNYSRIYSALNQYINYDCRPPRCTSSTLAYVYKNQYYHPSYHQIQICNAFWGHHSSKVDKADILLHEMSHFSNVANTDDLGLFPNGAMSLARTNPNQAIHNSYAYQYYAYDVAHSSNNGGGNGGGGNTGNLNYEFNNGNVQGWTYRNLNQAYGGPHNGSWFFQANANDPQLISPNININANVIKKITIRMANAFTSPYYSNLQLFWRNGNNGYSESRSKIISVTNHGGWTTYTIDMSHDYRWRGNISQIRIDPLTRGDGHWIGIDYIRFSR